MTSVRKRDDSGAVELRSRLKGLRQILGMSQRQMAQEFLVSNGAISQWETGERPIPGPIIRLMDIYELNLGMICNQENGKSNTSWVSRSLRDIYTPKKMVDRFSLENVKQLVASHERSARIKDASASAIKNGFDQAIESTSGYGKYISAIFEGILGNSSNVLLGLESETDYSFGSISRKEIDDLIHREFGCGTETLFSEINRQPLAATAMFQYFRGATTTGQRVLIRVTNPSFSRDLQETNPQIQKIQEFIQSLFRYSEPNELLTFAEKVVSNAGDNDLCRADHLKLAAVFEGDKGIGVAGIIESHSSPSILTIDFSNCETIQELCENGTKERIQTVAKEFVKSFWKKAINGNIDLFTGNAEFFIDGDNLILSPSSSSVKVEKRFLNNWRTLYLALLEDDRVKIKKSLRGFGILPFGEKVDLDSYIDNCLIPAYKPFITDAVFKFDQQYLGILMHTILQYDEKFRWRIGESWVLFHRFLYGITYILAALGAESNWYKQLSDLLLQGEA